MIDNISSRILVMCNLTNDCNQKCIHCISNARAGERIELNLETVERFISYMLGIPEQGRPVIPA